MTTFYVSDPKHGGMVRSGLRPATADDLRAVPQDQCRNFARQLRDEILLVTTNEAPTAVQMKAAIVRLLDLAVWHEGWNDTSGSGSSSMSEQVDTRTLTQGYAAHVVASSGERNQ